MIREAEPRDAAALEHLMKIFYQSPAVLRPIPDRYIQATLREALNGSPYIRVFLFEVGGETAGYATISLTFSGEAGGLVVWLEEIYILERFRGRGLCGAFMDFVEEAYCGRARRFRLEVEPANEAASRLYRRKGYTDLPYRQMVKEVPEDERAVC